MTKAPADYPLTLAEVLFEELETTNSADLKLVPETVSARLQEIRDLPTLSPEAIRQICKAEGITSSASGHDLRDQRPGID